MHESNAESSATGKCQFHGISNGIWRCFIWVRNAWIYHHSNGVRTQTHWHSHSHPWSYPFSGRRTRTYLNSTVNGLSVRSCTRNIIILWSRLLNYIIRVLWCLSCNFGFGHSHQVIRWSFPGGCSLRTSELCWLFGNRALREIGRSHINSTIHIRSINQLCWIT